MTREEAIRILSTRDAHGVLCGYTSGVPEALNIAIEALSARPKGKWIVKTDGIIFKREWGICSECGNTLDFSGVNAGRGNSNYCPNCGAVMEVEHDGR